MNTCSAPALLAAALFLLAGCGSHEPPPPASPASEAPRPAPVQALVGVWSDTTRAHDTWEHWRTQDDSTLIGMGCALDGTDTVSIEQLRLEQRNGQWVYRVRVGQQADAAWVPFNAERTTADSLVFENGGNDFPQCITYVRRTDGGWDVSVSGNEQGRERVDRYHFLAIGK